MFYKRLRDNIFICYRGAATLKKNKNNKEKPKTIELIDFPMLNINIGTFLNIKKKKKPYLN